jgi:hypothetical protein
MLTDLSIRLGRALRAVQELDMALAELGLDDFGHACRRPTEASQRAAADPGTICPSQGRLACWAPAGCQDGAERVRHLRQDLQPAPPRGASREVLFCEMSAEGGRAAPCRAR